MGQKGNLAFMLPISALWAAPVHGEQRFGSKNYRPSIAPGHRPPGRRYAYLLRTGKKHERYRDSSRAHFGRAVDGFGLWKLR